MPGWSALGLAGKLTAIGLVLAILLAVVIWIANWDPFGSKKRLETRAATAEVQSKVDTATVEAVDRYTHSVTVIREKADVAARAAETAPGADAPIPADVLDAWRSGLRNGSEGANDHGSGVAPR
jgi:hypothetical protein